MDSLPISLTDLAVAVILILSGILALARGFVHEVLSIASWVGAAFAALYGFSHVKPYARDLIGNDFFADIAAGAGTFILALIILTIITKLIAEQVQGSALNPLDRSLGFVFGLLRGVIVVCLLYGAIEWMVPVDKQPDWLREAKTMPMIEQGTDILVSLIPQDAADEADSKARETQKQIDNTLELKKSFDKMLTPEAKSDKTGANSPEGYGEQQRDEMNRVFQSTQ